MRLSEDKVTKLNSRVTQFLSTMDRYTFIVFDLETNGLSHLTDSVLSISALKCNIKSRDKVTLVGSYNRYYYPEEGEEYNPGALAVNGLHEEVITERRKGATYPREFLQDIDAFKEFCGDCVHFVGHNSITFDQQFFKSRMEFPYMFDTKTFNEDIVEAANEEGLRKPPRLSEAAVFYGIDPTGPLHQSQWDAMLTAKVFQAMLAKSEVKLDRRFLVT